MILLMFGVGLHFSPKDLLSVRAVAVPVTLLQILVTMSFGIGAALMFGWSIEAGVIFGLALSVASTVVALRSLQERRLMQTERGKLTVGWLVVEDLAMVVAMVLIPTWADIRGEVANGNGEGVTVLQLQDAGLAVLITLGKVLAFALIMLLAGKRVVPWILHRVVHMGSRELFRLAVLAIALGVAYAASAFFDISFALGALFAGLIMAESELSQQAANETLPLRDAFAVIFFVSVGMLFDPMILLQNPWPLLATVTIIVVLRTLLSLALLRIFGQDLETSASVTASRAQIGEFSFILAGLGLQLGLLPEEGRDLILGGAIISIMLNPAVFAIADRVGPEESHRRCRCVDAAASAATEARGAGGVWPRRIADRQGAGRGHGRVLGDRGSAGYRGATATARHRGDRRQRDLARGDAGGECHGSRLDVRDGAGRFRGGRHRRAGAEAQPESQGLCAGAQRC